MDKTEENQIKCNKIVNRYLLAVKEGLVESKKNPHDLTRRIKLMEIKNYLFNKLLFYLDKGAKINFFNKKGELIFYGLDLHKLLEYYNILCEPIENNDEFYLGIRWRIDTDHMKKVGDSSINYIL